MNRNYQGSVIQTNNGTLKAGEFQYSGSGYALYGTSDSTLLLKVYNTDKFSRFLQTERNSYKLLKLNPHIGYVRSGEMLNMQVVLMEKGIMLEKILQKLQENLSEPQVIKIIRDVSRSLNFSHSQGVVHRDIRAENVILGSDGKFKIQNFQRATFQIYTRVPNDIRQQVFEEIEYIVLPLVRAPEQLDTNPGFELREKVDIYALGMLVYQSMFKRKWEPSKPAFTSQYSDKICQLVSLMLRENPIERPSSYQIEQFLESFQVGGSLQQYQPPPPEPLPIHVRSKSQNAARRQVTENITNKTKDEVSERFTGLDYVEPAAAKPSSWYVQMIKYVSRFSNKTEGWVLACIEDNDEGPKQKYVRYLIVKAWNKKQKIGKFYSTLGKFLKANTENTVMNIKAMVLLHNYFKKGPIEAMTYSAKDIGAQELVKKTHTFWKVINEQIGQKFVPDRDKDRARSLYTSKLLSEYSQLLLEKLRLCVHYKNYFEGNYSLNPFFISLQKGYKPLTIGIIENLLRFWRICMDFTSLLFQESVLVRIQFSLGLSMIDEIYCLLSLVCHLLYAFKHSTNYIEGELNPKVIRERFQKQEEIFAQCYTRSLQFFNQCRNSQLFINISTMIPILPLTMLDMIMSIPLFQPVMGDFNIFEFLDVGKSLVGVKIPLSYGEAVVNIKIENEELINLNTNNERFETNGGGKATKENKCEVLETLKKNVITGPVKFTNEPNFSKSDFDNFKNKQTMQKSEFNVYNEFSHQTYSKDFNLVQSKPIINQKNLKIFDFDYSQRSVLEETESNQSQVMKNQLSQQSSFLNLDKVQTQKKAPEPVLTQTNQQIKQNQFRYKNQRNQQKASKKNNNSKVLSSGYQDLSFSSGDDEVIDDGPDLNQNKRIQSIELNQKASQTRALTEKEDFLALPVSQEKLDKSQIQVPKLVTNFAVEFPPPIKTPTPNNPFNSNENDDQLFLPTPTPVQQQNLFAQFPINKPPSPNKYQQQRIFAPLNSAQPQVKRLIYKKNKSLMMPTSLQQKQKNEEINYQQQYKPQQQQQKPNYFVPPPQQIQQPQKYPIVQAPPQFPPQAQKSQTQAFELYKFITQELNTNAADWIINISQLTLDQKIGTGSSCEVFKGYWKGNEVAIKKMKIKSLSENHLKEFRREITALVQIKPHKNLVSLIGISQQDDELYIVTEFCAGGTMFDLLHRHKNTLVPWQVRIKMCYQIAQGMCYLHELQPPIIHRDLKSLNLLLENTYDQSQKINIKIADFGLARTQVDAPMTGVLGTFHWMAPEIFESKPYSIMADVYSFGIVVWEICSRETPYRNFQTPHAIMKYVTIDKGRPDLNSIQDGCPIVLRDLIIQCWDHDPNQRPTFQEISSTLRSLF